MTNWQKSTPPSIGRHAIPLFNDQDSDFAAYCDPCLSLIIVPPFSSPNGWDERLGTLQYPVTIAGHYTQTPLPHVIRGQMRRAEQAIRSLQSKELPEIASRLVNIETRCRYLFEAFEGVFRTVIQWELQQLFSDDGFIEWYASNYAVDNPSVQSEDIQQYCETMVDNVGCPYPVSEFGQILTELTEDYPTRVVRLVVKLVLSPPLQLMNAEESTQYHGWNLDLTQRFRQLADTLAQEIDTEAQETDGSLGCSLQALEERLLGESNLSVRLLTDGTERQLLLDVPHQEGQQVATEPIKAELTGYPSGIAWLLNASYTESGFGGVVYPRENGDSKWLINPWVADSIVSTDQTYRQLMSESIVADHLLRELFVIVEEPESNIDDFKSPMECPLCRFYPGQCGETGCAFDKQITQFNAQKSDLATFIPEEIEQLSDEQRELFYS